MQDSNPLGPAIVVPQWHVPVAVGLWTISIFLLYQGAAFLKWVTKGEKTAPDARAGVILAWILSAGSLLFFYFQSTIIFSGGFETDTTRWMFDFIIGLVTFSFKDPDGFSRGLLFSSLPIGVIAAYKFVITVTLARSTQVKTSARTQSPVTLLIGGIFTFLQLAGSVASLVAILR
jgi:hypothetical protein